MRNRYIRFFVSSTFEDMTKERDLLQEVLNNLGKEYSQKGWQIEAVDLRWGISEEAGLDNKTMQICKTELKRCQELSPKPNFIILLGNRYGWLPLPEIVSLQDGRGILNNSAIRKELKDLFLQWYRLDHNALPNGEFILQRRTCEYIKKEVWEKEVEKPLSELFSYAVENSLLVQNRFQERNTHYISQSLYGQSATELEIQQGALSVSDAHEHVIAYFRDFSDIQNLSKNLQKTYYETDNNADIKLQKLSTLKKRLKRKLSDTNILEETITWSEYLTDDFSATFKDNIEKHLRVIINQTISESSTEEDDSENQKHRHIASEKAINFVGRHKELNYLDSYITDSEQRDVLLLSGPSGAGKSALMGRIIEKYSESHQIICRFCGTTEETSDTERLLSSITNEIYSLYGGEGQELPNIFLNIEIQKPLLLIIDAINEILEGDKLLSFLGNFTPWRKDDNEKTIWYPLPNNLKIIITTTPINFKKHSPFISVESNVSPIIKKYELGNMGDDSLLIIQRVLASYNRGLTNSQYTDLKTIIESSDKSALYLHILGNYLADSPSWENISSIPNNLSELIISIINNLSLPERHGDIVKEILSLLVLERSGLTDNEILQLIALDEEFYISLKSKSYHKWNDDKYNFVPPILWFRLKYELKYFIKEHRTNYGITTAFFHNGIKESIYKFLIQNNEERLIHFYLLLYQYYKKTFDADNIHSQLELLHCGVMAAKFSIKEPWYNDLCVELKKYLEEDFGFIRSLICLASPNLLPDMGDALCYVKLPLREITTLREIISDYISGPNLWASLKRLPSNHVYRKVYESLEESKIYMEDSLSDTYVDCIIYTVGEIGESPCMNDDGTKVASIFDDGHEVKIQDLVNPSKSTYFRCQDKIMEIRSDCNLRYYAIKFENKCMVYDFKMGKVLGTFSLEKNGWIDLSHKGAYFIIGEEYTVYLFDINHISECKGAANAVSCKVSPSENYVWVITSEGVLWRFGTDTLEKRTSFPVEIEKKNPFLSKNSRIHTCSDNICICSADDIGIYVFYNEIEWSKSHYSYYYAREIKLAKIDANDEKMIIVDHDDYPEVFANTKDLTNPQYVSQSKYMSETYLKDILVVNSDLSKALVGNQIINLPLALQKFSIGKGGNCGLNGMSTDNSGNQILVASGINALQDYQIDLGRVSFGEKSRWIPPFIDTSYKYIAGVAVSPDGKFMTASSAVESQLICCSLTDDTMLNSFPIKPKDTPTDGERTFNACIGINYSQDSRYVAAMTGHHFADDSHVLYILNSHGKILQLYTNMDDNWTNNGTIGFTANNRYFYSAYKRCMVKDIVMQYDLTKEDDMNSTTINIDSYHFHLKCFDIVINNTPFNSIITQRNNKLYQLDLLTQKIHTTECDMTLLACSPTGRYLYFASDTKFYLRKYQSEEYSLLYDTVTPSLDKRILPAFDDDHIYIICHGSIILYNIKKKKEEQKAFCEGGLFYKVCAKGLAVTTSSGNIHLFSPNKYLCVNKPAVTNFVRRWNLETNIQEAPTAICPMCGGRIEITRDLQNILLEQPHKYSFEDWDNPKLFGHHCPHCRAQLQFNPYII